MQALLLAAACSESNQPVAPAAEKAPAVRETEHSNPTSGGIPWFDGSVEQAFAEAKKADKPIFLYWGAEWCPPCHQLKATIFRRDEFIAQSRLFVPVYLDGDTERAQKYGEQFGVYGYPTVIIFSPAGEEITRIPGGMDIEQYLSVLELALNALRPVSDLLAMVESGEALRDGDWKLLANYSWGQDRGKALGEREVREVYTLLAQACPDRLAMEKSQLQMLAIDNWARDEERDVDLAPAYLQQVDAILADDALTRSNLGSFIASGGYLVEGLAEGDEQLALQRRISERLEAAVGDEALDVLLRLAAIYGWADVNKALLAEEEQLAQPQQAWVMAQVKAAESELSSYQQHAAINTISQLYYEIGREDLARASLERGMAVSRQPYYFMSAMGYLEKEAGNNEAAVNWYRKAWEAARGPATRVQWGINYLSALLELSPGDVTVIGATGNTVFAELAAQPDGLHHRNIARMDRLGERLLAWSEASVEEERAAIPERQAVVSALRGEMDKLCEGVSGEGDAAETCASFLVPQPEEENG
jgi:thioredoxin-related protein